MADLGVLRTSKSALDEHLITQEDFDLVKMAFLRAQQIKAGMDAGFLREEDYKRAREAFLHALDFSNFPSSPEGNANGHSGGGMAPLQPMDPPPRVQSGWGPPRRQPSGGSSSQQLVHTSSFGGQPSLPQLALEPQHSGRVGNLKGAVAAAVAAADAAPSSPKASPRSPRTNGSTPRSVSGGGSRPPSAPASRAALDSAVSTAKGGALTDGKKSMAGIRVNQECVTLFGLMKTRSTYKWATFKIDDSGREVIVDQLGEPSMTYEDFLAVLPEHQCRYGLFDYMYTSEDRHASTNKLVFLHWAPDTSNTRSKMMYASTKDFFKGFLDGIGAEMQATEASELAESEMRDKVTSNMTRK